MNKASDWSGRQAAVPSRNIHMETSGPRTCRAAKCVEAFITRENKAASAVGGRVLRKKSGQERSQFRKTQGFLI